MFIKYTLENTEKDTIIKLSEEEIKNFLIKNRENDCVMETNNEYTVAIEEWINSKYSDESFDRLLCLYNKYKQKGGNMEFSHFIGHYKNKSKCKASIDYSNFKCPFLSSKNKCKQIKKDCKYKINN